MSGRRAKAQSNSGGPKTRPSRSTSLPATPSDRTLDYAKRRDELTDIEPGGLVLAGAALRRAGAETVALLVLGCHVIAIAATTRYA